MIGVFTRLPVIVSEALYPRSPLVVTSKGESTTASLLSAGAGGADWAKAVGGRSAAEITAAHAETARRERKFMGTRWGLGEVSAEPTLRGVLSLRPEV